MQGQRRHLVKQNTKINAYHMSLVGLPRGEDAGTRSDGDGTLLDHAILVHGSGMGDGDKHTPVNLAVDPRGWRVRHSSSRRAGIWFTRCIRRP